MSPHVWKEALCCYNTPVSRQVKSRKRAALPCVNILQGKINKSILKAGIQQGEDNKTISAGIYVLIVALF